MVTRFRKQILGGVSLILVIMVVTIPGIAAVSAGQGIDILIPKFEGMLDDLNEILFNNTYTVSTKQVIGKAGSIFIDMDDGEIRMIGDTSYRTYVFKDKTGTAFKCYLGIVLIGVDNSNATDIGVKVYVTEANTTRVLSETEISTLAAQFIALLY